ncbi:hypothetical protein BHM03_00030916 [Ensete ventricosum]|nr:hypothetical protein BHM03_00030916 [Ensete ventricosum]
MTGAMELQPDDGKRSSLGIEPGSDDAMGSRWEFARRFTEGIGKLARNTLGDHRKKTIGLAARMLEDTRLDWRLITIEGFLQLGLTKVMSMHRVDAVGNLPGVYQELAKGVGSLPGWRKRVHQKNTETRRKIVGGSRKACRDSLGDSPKGSGSSGGNTSRDRRKKTIGLTARMPEAVGLGKN